MKEPYEYLRTDVLIVGGGGAGARAAIEAARHGVDVTLVSRGSVGKCGLTVMGGGGLAAVMGTDPRDSPEIHFRDTIVRGHYLNDQNLVDTLTMKAPERVRELEDWGAKLEPNTYLHLMGHTYDRGVYLKGPRLMKALSRGIQRTGGIRMLEDCIVTKLLAEKGVIHGAVVLNMKEGLFIAIRAKAIVLATGGLGELFSVSPDSPHGFGDASGAGFALAYHIGAELVDMEFIQFLGLVVCYPLGARNLVVPDASPLYLHPKIYNARGEEFLKDLMFENIRDVVAKAVDAEIRAGGACTHGGIIIDFTKSPLASKFNALPEWQFFSYKHLKSIGIDPAKTPLECKPGALFACGGIRINERAETNIEGLYAAGEVAGNAHGGNRIAGNAFAEIIVFGAEAGAHAAEHAKSVREPDMNFDEFANECNRLIGFLQEDGQDFISPVEVKKRLQQLMYDHAGVTRDSQGLERLISDVAEIRRDILPRVKATRGCVYNLEWLEAIELPLMLDTAEIVARSALFRAESRGCHMRIDYPITDNKNWLKHTLTRLTNGVIKVTSTDIVVTKLEPPRG